MTDTTKWVIGFVITLTVAGFGFIYNWGDDNHTDGKAEIQRVENDVAQAMKEAYRLSTKERLMDQAADYRLRSIRAPEEEKAAYKVEIENIEARLENLE